MTSQSAPAVVMVTPHHFGSNPETAATNKLQQGPAKLPAEDSRRVHSEFEGLVRVLEKAGVRMLLFDSPPKHITPDAVFPNNWFSTHADGTVVLYPMLAPSRRLERQSALTDALSAQHGYHIERILDLTHLETVGECVEGTGSLVLDRVHRISYAAISSRTTAKGAQAAAKALGYTLCAFTAQHASGTAIYHTNVMLSIGSEIAIGCFESIRDSAQRQEVLQTLEGSGKRIVYLNEEQMLDFAANVLELQGVKGPLLALSTRALSSLSADQRRILEASLDLCPASIDTIERIGGGGVRCMLAEIHLPKSG